MPSHLTPGPETLSHLFAKLTLDHATRLNLKKVNIYNEFTPSIPKHDNFYQHEAHKRTVLHAMCKYLYTYEIEAVLTKYKMATIDEETVFADFFNSDIEPHPIVRDPNYLTALEYATEAFKPDCPVRPVHILDVQHHYPFNRSTNAEAPFSTSTHYRNMLPKQDPPLKPTTGNMLHIIFEFTREWHHKIKDLTSTFDEYLFYMLLHIKKTVIKAEDPNKLRSIWGVPKPWIIAQIMFHWSLFANYRRNPKKYPLLWGYETILGGWFRLNSELFTGYIRRSFIMIDWKRYDKYVPHEGITDVHNITESYIDFDHGYLPTKDYPDTSSTWTQDKANRLRRLYSWTLHAYKHTPIVLPDGSAYVRQHATLPSGLYTTQYYDSFWNYIMLATILLSLGFDPRLCIIKVLGDDSIIRLYVLIPPHLHDQFFLAMQTSATYYFGSIISLNKSKIVSSLNQCEVLGYSNNNGLPHRSLLELCAKLYNSKSRNPTPEISMGVAIGIAYANLGFHKRLHYVCKDIYDYYASHGVTPSQSGFTSVYYTDPHTAPSINIETFPTIPEIQSHLLSLEYVNEKVYNRFFDRSHFLSDF
jgi:hypothetical protein